LFNISVEYTQTFFQISNAKSLQFPNLKRVHGIHIPLWYGPSNLTFWKFQGSLRKPPEFCFLNFVGRGEVGKGYEVRERNFKEELVHSYPDTRLQHLNA
jgi:hypothetical protein